MNVTHNKSHDGCCRYQTTLSHLPSYITKMLSSVCDEELGTSSNSKHTWVILTVQISTYPVSIPLISSFHFSVSPITSRRLSEAVFSLWKGLDWYWIWRVSVAVWIETDYSYFFLFCGLRDDEWRLRFSQLFLAPQSPRNTTRYFLFVCFSFKI